MKIIGGSFGVKGTARISEETLFVNGSRQARYQATDINNIVAATNTERRFSLISFIIGAVVFSLFFGLLFNIVGIVIGLVVATVTSFYSVSSAKVELNFVDGSILTLACSGREIEALYAFWREEAPVESMRFGGLPREAVILIAIILAVGLFWLFDNN